MTSRDRMTPEIGVIGTASLDVLHLGEKTVSTVGGAGLYTALAAAKAGAAVVFCAPRPAPMPAALRPVAARVSWNGPVIAPDALPRLEIAHHGEGRATLLAASWGAEPQLTPVAPPRSTPACRPGAYRRPEYGPSGSSTLFRPLSPGAAHGSGPVYRLGRMHAWSMARRRTCVPSWISPMSFS